MSAARQRSGRSSDRGGNPLRSANPGPERQARSARATPAGPSAARRAFPAWIVADESGVAFPAIPASSRLRSSQAPRPARKSKPLNSKGASDGHGAR